MKPTDRDDLRVRDAAFKNVLALYASIKDSHNSEIKNGKNTDAIDFMADVEIKARRALEPGDYEQFSQVLRTDPNNYEKIPQVIRAAVGKEFILSDMVFSGTYRKLYFRIKNNS